MLVRARNEVRDVDRRDGSQGRAEHTLMKPPSGFALRNAGWAVTLGCKSDTFRSFFISGTGPLTVIVGATRRGDLGSAEKEPSMGVKAELG